MNGAFLHEGKRSSRATTRYVFAQYCIRWINSFRHAMGLQQVYSARSHHCSYLYDMFVMGGMDTMSGWPSGLRRQTQAKASRKGLGVLVLVWGRGFKSHFWQTFFSIPHIRGWRDTAYTAIQWSSIKDVQYIFHAPSHTTVRNNNEQSRSTNQSINNYFCNPPLFDFRSHVMQSWSKKFVRVAVWTMNFQYTYHSQNNKRPLLSEKLITFLRVQAAIAATLLHG